MESQSYKIKQQPEDFIVIEEPSIKPEESGEYLLYLMKKRNYTTEDAVQNISRTLAINRKNIGYAGNKDSHAITTQLISIRGTTKDRVLQLEFKDIDLKFYGFSSNPVSLGDLTANCFEITIRNITKLPLKIEKVVNYFGEQRFSINNSDVGKAIIKKDFKKAFDLICDASRPDKEVLEEHLVTNKNDYVGAVKRLPWKTLNLYIHAYQSKLWNEASAEYIKTHSENIDLPLVGFSTDFDEITEKIYSPIMTREQIKQSDFIIRAIPGLSSAGSVRKIYSEIHDLSIGTLDEDELNLGMKKCKVTFKLGKGSYATEAIKSMIP